MEIRVKEDSVEIEGYVNAIERNSKPLWSRVGQFVERICKGAFKKALKRNDDVHILLNHDWNRDLGSTKKGNLELEEDNIGLKARATITDPDVIKKARNGELVGWSFGFQDREVENTIEKGMPYRAVRDLDLAEVSILDRSKTPAYDGTLIMARDEGAEMHFRGEDFIDEIVLKENEPVKESEDKKELEEVREELPKQQEDVVENKDNQEIDYSKYETMIKEMKEE
jgi:HK97 family phage prohead protease